MFQAQEDPILAKLKKALQDKQDRIVPVKLADDSSASSYTTAFGYIVIRKDQQYYFLPTTSFKKIMGTSRAVIEFLVKKKIILPGSQAKTYTRQQWISFPHPGKNVHGYLLDPSKLGI